MKIEIVRPDDLVNLLIEAINLRLNSDNLEKPLLVAEDPNQPSYLVITFPPQTIAEGAYFEAGGDDDDPANEGSKRTDTDAGKKDPEPLDMPGQLDQSGKANPKADPSRLTNAQLGHPSRLVFKVPADASIPFSIKGLLDWTGFELVVNPIAAIGPSPTPDQIASAPAIQPPGPHETKIELPYRLMISPNRDVTWKHRINSFTSRGRTELWHTRLALKTSDGVIELSHEQRAPLRAIWSPDYDPNNIPHPQKKDPYLARTAMSPNDRHQIVVLTSAFHGYEGDIDFSTFILADEENTTLNFELSKPFDLTVTVPYVAQPFWAEQLMLSPLGGWLRSQGHWFPPRKAASIIHHIPDIDQILKPLESLTEYGPNVASARPVNVSEVFAAVSDLTSSDHYYQLDLSEWTHIATQGRDHYVRIVYEGELWPFRHRASLIKVTERKFKEHDGIVGAYLIQRMFIVVREPDKKINHRGSPFKQVRLTTLVTPDIAKPKIIQEKEPGKDKKTNYSFWVEVEATNSPTGRELFKFHAIGTDHGNKAIDFTVPLIFVSISDVNDLKKANLVEVEYNDKKNISTRNAEISGQKVMFAEQDKDPEKRNDNTQLVTQAVNFVIDPADNAPRMLKAQVKIPQVQELLGTDTLTTIRYLEHYINENFDSATGVFAEVVKEDLTQFKPDNPYAAIVPDTVGVNFSSDKAGGFATPNMAISSLTRELGPLAGKVEDALINEFNPDEFFKGVTARLFGSFDLVDLLRKKTALGRNAPKLLARTQDNNGGDKLLIARLDWEPEFLEPDKKLDPGIAAIEKDYGGKKSKLHISGLIQKPVNIGETSVNSVKSEFTGTLDNFSISVLKSVYINFAEFSFKKSSRQKYDITVRLVEENAAENKYPLEFKNDLKFVDELRRAIPPNLFSKESGPSIDLLENPRGIRAGFAFSLPPLAVGVFALRDVSLGAALTLPFIDGKPVFDFNVSERAHPFLLTVSLFGGGGFFRLQLDTAGIKELQAALEFGAAAAIDIGVASGEVHIMAGIYFSLQRKDGSAELAAVLSGYLRMGGSLSVLGLIRVSVEFNLSFTYDNVHDKAYGRATLTVHIEVAFFSKSVELTVERAFGGSGDPDFGELFKKPEVWRDYALAFA